MCAKAPGVYWHCAEPAFLCAAEVDGGKHRLNLCLLDENGVANKQRRICGIGIGVAARKQAARSQSVEHMLDAGRFGFGCSYTSVIRLLRMDTRVRVGSSTASGVSIMQSRETFRPLQFERSGKSENAGCGKASKADWAFGLLLHDHSGIVLGHLLDRDPFVRSARQQA